MASLSLSRHCMLLIYLWSNYLQTWHGFTLGQNLSKTIKKFDDIIAFCYWSRTMLEILYFLFNLAEIWHMGHVETMYFKFEKKSDMNKI